MAINDTWIAVAPAVVFAVLADPDSYADWVVGASDIRDADATWPARSSVFHHTQGVPHIGLKDTTSVIDVEPSRRLVLEVRARPVVVARVELELVAEGYGTRVTMTERPIGGWLRPLDGRVLDAVIARRNALSLRRLRRLCQRAPQPSTASA